MTNIKEIVDAVDAVSRVDDVPAQEPSRNFRPGHWYDGTGQEIDRPILDVLPRQGSTPTIAQDRNSDGSQLVYRRPASPQLIICGSRSRQRPAPEAAPLE